MHTDVDPEYGVVGSQTPLGSRSTEMHVVRTWPDSTLDQTTYIYIYIYLYIYSILECGFLRGGKTHCFSEATSCFDSLNDFHTFRTLDRDGFSTALQTARRFAYLSQLGSDVNPPRFSRDLQTARLFTYLSLWEGTGGRLGSDVNPPRFSRDLQTAR